MKTRLHPGLVSSPSLNKNNQKYTLIDTETKSSLCIESGGHAGNHLRTSGPEDRRLCPLQRNVWPPNECSKYDMSFEHWSNNITHLFTVVFDRWEEVGNIRQPVNILSSKKDGEKKWDDLRKSDSDRLQSRCVMIRLSVRAVQVSVSPETNKQHSRWQPRLRKRSAFPSWSSYFSRSERFLHQTVGRQNGHNVTADWPTSKNNLPSTNCTFSRRLSLLPVIAAGQMAVDWRQRARKPLLDFSHQAAFSPRRSTYLATVYVIEITVTPIANASKWIIEQL